MTRRIALLVGTRPEAIKLAPVILGLRSSGAYEPVVISTGQHREMLSQVFAAFGIEPDVELDLMRHDQTPAELASRALAGVSAAVRESRPDAVIVQGDTTTAMVGAIASAYERVPVAHVEAGLRSFDRGHPFPEEMNRVVIGRVADFHFAPTELARSNLLDENVPADRIVVTGNTVVDALRIVSRGLAPPVEEIPSDRSTRTILVTLHRRETLGLHLARICRAIALLVDRNPGVNVLFPVHWNPNVRTTVNLLLAGRPRIQLVDPLGYVEFIRAMMSAEIILTDSGGVQEEAPSLHKPVLVLRDKTERPEVIECGAARLVGRDPVQILRHAEELLRNPAVRDRMANAGNPYGDGRAAERVIAGLTRFLAPEWAPKEREILRLTAS